MCTINKRITIRDYYILFTLTHWQYYAQFARTIRIMCSKTNPDSMLDYKSHAMYTNHVAVEFRSS